MNQLKKIFLGASLLFALSLPTFVMAASSDVSTDTSSAQNTTEVGYNIQAILPENQVNDQDSFFNLRMEPSQEQTIQFVINNTSSEETTFALSINQAYTNTQGFIDYSDADAQLDDSLKYAISDIATVDNSVTVAANSSATVPIELKMPAEEYAGQILAAIQVIKEQDDDSSGISNSYGYILGLKLTENDQAVTRELNLLSVEPAISFGNTSVVATLQNPTMDAFGHLVYHADVYNLADNEIVRSVDYDNNMQMAPNSTYGFAIDWDNQALEAGDYRLALTVGDAKGNVWEFDEAFTITEQQAQEINSVTVDEVNTQRLPIWVFIVIGAMTAIVLLFIIWLILAKRRKKDESDQR
ncbi:DUF916 and DUF3324 domain-containing protein [Enterococcus sp. LJL90]